MIRAIIIDDESSSVNVLSLLLQKYCADKIEVVATTNSPYFGKELIDEHSPDLVFMDIEMPGMSGIDLLSMFPNPVFRCVFITAFDSFAIEAFRLSAMDYLLKPLEADDIIRVIKKIEKDISARGNSINMQLRNLENILLNNQQSNEPKIAIGMADKIVFIAISDIMYCTASGAYTNIHLQNGKVIVASKSLVDFEAQLLPQRFLRIHHATLININQVKEFQKLDGGYVIMENNTRLEVSQRKRKDFLEAIRRTIV